MRYGKTIADTDIPVRLSPLKRVLLIVLLFATYCRQSNSDSCDSWIINACALRNPPCV